MPNHNPTRTNYLSNSVDFNPNALLVNLPYGADNTIEFAHIPVFPTSFNFSGAFAIEAWVKPSGETLIRSRIVQTPEVGTNGVTTAFMLGLLGDETFYDTNHNALRIGMSVFVNGEADNVQVTCDPVIKHNTWHHIVGQYTGIFSDEVTIYVDGCKRDTVIHADLNYKIRENTGGTDATGLVVGWDADLEAPFKGAMASLAFFNRLLTSEEIETLAQGISNLLAPKSLLKPNVVAWWQMGDGDPANLSQLLDSVSTNHFTTVNMDNTNLLTEIPKERPRKHQCTHARTGGDELKLDPNSFGSPFLWDSFKVIDIDTALPHGWFGNTDDNDRFNRINIPGRLAVLNFHKVSDGEGFEVMFITNISSTAVGNTLKFGPSDSAGNTTEYSMEFVASSRSNTGNGIHYIGWIENPHGYTDPSTEPQTGVFIRWDNNTNELKLIVADAGNTTEEISTLSDDQFHKFKLSFKYFHDETPTDFIEATLKINDELTDPEFNFTATVSAAALSYPDPSKTADVFIGTSMRSNGNYDFDIAWLSIIHRGIGHTIVIPSPP